MSTIKLLHAADFHLDSPFSGLSPEKGALRRREMRQLPARLSELVRSEGVQLVLLPGDLFDAERPRRETVEALSGALEEMAVPVFIAPGNHDYYHANSPYAAAWPDNVHIFTEPALRAVELPELGCVVHGCAFTAPRREDDPLRGFTAANDGRTHLLCVHGELGQAGFYAPIAPESLAAGGARYAALGHAHTAKNGRAGVTLWAYPGCPEGRGFDECGPKGVLLVTLGGAAELRFVPVCQRQYRIETVALDADRPPDFSALAGTPDLVRLILRGERARPLDLTGLEARWADGFFHLEFQDETTLPRDLWARAGEDSLTGLFLRQMRKRLDQAEGEARQTLLLATRFGLAALEGGEDIRP